MKDFNISFDNGKIFFHRTSHEGAILIDEQIEIIPATCQILVFVIFM